MANKTVTEKRDIYIGGSDVKEIVDPYYHSSVYHFALHKAGIIESYFDGNKYTRYGELMETEIRKYINETQNYEFIEHCIIDEDNKFRGNLDGIDLNKKIMLEIKTCGEEVDIQRYMYQVQFYLELAYRFHNVKTCILATYVRPSDFYNGISYSIHRNESYFDTELIPQNLTLHIIKRDDKYFKKILPCIHRFKKALEQLKLNPKMSQQEFNTLFFGTNLVTQTHGLVLLQRKINQYKELENELESAKKEIYKIFSERGIKQYCDQNIKITHIEPCEVTTITIDQKRLAHDNPDIFNKYKKTTKTKRKGYVRLTIK